MKVTRIAYSKNLDHSKCPQLGEQAVRLGRVRSLVWRRYGSVCGVGVRDRTIRDQWMATGTAAGFGVLANAWKETVRDAVADIAAHREAAKAKVRRAIGRLDVADAEKKRFYTALNTNRRLAAWTKGITAEALQNVSGRRVSAVRLVDAAYTSQVIPVTNTLGVRDGDRLDCTVCGAVWHADHAAAINILERDGDPDISPKTPYRRVYQILRERNDRQRTRLPVQDSSTRQPCQCGERIIQVKCSIQSNKQEAVARAVVR